MNFARLNHILIPTTKDDRDRWRESKWSRYVFEPLVSGWFALSDEGRILFGFTFVTGLAGLDVQRSESHALFALLLALIVASLAVRRVFRLSGVRLEVAGPDRVAVGEPALFQLTLRNTGAAPHFGLRVERPFLPWDGKWQGRAPRLAELSVGARSPVDAVARFAARGPHHIDPFSAAALVPLGLALGPRRYSSGVRFTVVPRLARVALAPLARSSREQAGSIALAPHTGESMELMGVRPYRPGDAMRDLHAVTWARTGEPSVREYRQENFTRVAVVFDTDPAGASEERFEAGVSLVAGIVAGLCQGEEQIDLLMAGERTRMFTPGTSLGRLDQALDHLADIEPGDFAGERMLAALKPNLARLSSLVFVCFEWGERHQTLARAIELAGVACRSVVVCDRHAKGGKLSDSATRANSSLRRVDFEQVIAASHAGPELTL